MPIQYFALFSNNNLGVVFNELGEVQKAITCYQKAINIKPDYADAYYNLGNALHKLNKYQEAIISYAVSYTHLTLPTKA